jgi:diadenosine tetraphosphatase ApaH/serine/threonine PP2A family protein phosphatase
VLHAIVSDLHGNLEGLEAVLADIDRRRPDDVVCLGDFVGYGASPNECIERTRPRLVGSIAGNHDLAATGRIRLGYFNPDAASAAGWTDVQLTPENRAWLEALPYSLEHHGALLVHASPASPGDWHYVLSVDHAYDEMEAYAQALCFIGHSHFPGVFERKDDDVRYTRAESVKLERDRRYLVNVGSVGQPRDGDPRAAYLLWDDAKGTLTHVRLDYDIEAAAKRILDAGLPRFLAERLRWGE